MAMSAAAMRRSVLEPTMVPAREVTEHQRFIAARAASYWYLVARSYQHEGKPLNALAAIRNGSQESCGPFYLAVRDKLADLQKEIEATLSHKQARLWRSSLSSSI